MNEQHQRARWHDYQEPGIYMLTIVAERRGTPFGHLEQMPDGSVAVCLSSLGQAVEAQIRELPSHEAGLTVMRYVVMPDHVHIVVHITQPMTRHLGTLVKGFKYGTTLAYLRDLDARLGGTHRIQDSRPSATQRKAGLIVAEEPLHTRPTASYNDLTSTGQVVGGLSAITPPPIPIPPLWSKGYHDRILYGRGQLTRMLNYVIDNPRRGWIKQQHRDLFYNKRMVDIPLTRDEARGLLREARCLGVMHELQGVLHVEQRSSADDTWRSFNWWHGGSHVDPEAEQRYYLRMKMMGNLFLLDEALLIPVRISRSIAQGVLQQQKSALLDRCEREGAVIITPAVSAGEEEVFNDVLDAGYHAIRLLAGAMSDVFAPSAELMEYVSRNQLLLIAPWPERSQSARPHKGIFELMNVLCRLLAART